MQDHSRGAARAALLTLAAVVVATCCVLGAGAVQEFAAHTLSFPQSAQPASPIPPLVIEAVAVDRKGELVTDLRTAEFDVTVNGRPRRGVSVAYLFSGPGSVEMASAQPGIEPGGLPPRAEPSRMVIVVADQGSFLPGDNRRAQAIAESCLGLLSLDDRVMFLRLPDLAGSRTLSADREPVRQALQQLNAFRPGYLSQAVKPAEAELPPDQADATQPAVTGDTPRPATADLEDLLGAMKTPNTETLSPAAAKAHATDMLRGVRGLLDALRAVPGGKTILLLSAGLILDDVVSEFLPVEAAAADAFARIYTIQVPTPSPRFAQLGRGGLESLAEITGGALVSLENRPAQTLQRLAAELSFSYLITLAPEPGDESGALARVSLKTRRKNVILRANAVLKPGREIPPPIPSPVGDSGKPAAAGPTRPAPKRDPEVDALLARASGYLDAYARNAPAVVAEEVYEQQLIRAVPSSSVPVVEGPSKRRLVSDFLLVKVPGLEGWLPFRDVFEVDGLQVRDRDDRLRRLFLEAPPERAVQNGNTILEESARYNIGGVGRNINLPTLALMFLQRANVPKSTFTRREERTVGGVRIREIAFEEVVRPALIRTRTSEQADLFASGTFWIEPVSGRVVRTELRVAGATITVTYEAREATAGLWVPVRMEEVYAYPSGRIEATATYSRFRRFQVFTEQQVKPPTIP